MSSVLFGVPRTRAAAIAVAFVWREWRAQRGLLLTWLLLSWAVLAGSLPWLSPNTWLDDGVPPLVLTGFLACGALSALAVVAPNLVAREVTAKDDTFVRRLPGALEASFVPKFLFLLAATAGLCISSCLVGHLVLTLLGHPVSEWIPLAWRLVAAGRLPNVASPFAEWALAGIGMSVAWLPWVWAIATWLPAGRMAALATVVVALLLAIALRAVLLGSPGLERTLPWSAFFASLFALGVVVAFVSWTRGRRGGGVGRSARVGLVASALVALPPAGWLAAAVHDYHHPDPQRLRQILGVSITPDGCQLLAYGGTRSEHEPAPFRIDLLHGTAEQLGSVGSVLLPLDGDRRSLFRTDSSARFWQLDDARSGAFVCLDLQTGERRVAARNPASRGAEVPDAWRLAVAAEPRRRTTLRASGGVRVWWEGTDLCLARDGEPVERRALDEEALRWHHPAGHGLWCSRAGERGLYGFVPPRWLPGWESGLCVGGSTLLGVGHGPNRVWRQRHIDGQETEVPALAGCYALGLLDDQRLLVVTCKSVAFELFTYDVVTERRASIAVPTRDPECEVQVVGPEDAFGSCVPRDPAGRVWLHLDHAGRRDLVALDPDALRCQTLVANWQTPFGSQGFLIQRLLAWPDADTAIVQRNDDIVERVDLRSGRRTQLFPRFLAAVERR